MAQRRRLQINIGKQSLGKVVYPSDPGYFESVRKQTKALTDELLSIFAQFEDVSEDIILDALRPTFEKSQAYCPVDTGNLKRSGYLEKVGFRGKPRVEMGYARGGVPHYAAIVHENLEMKHAHPTRAKFLEDAIKEDFDLIYERLVKGYREFMGP